MSGLGGSVGFGEGREEREEREEREGVVSGLGEGGGGRRGER